MLNDFFHKLAMIDKTINLGDLLTVGTIIIAVYSSYHKQITRLAQMELKVNTLWRKFVKDKDHDEEEQ